MKKLYFLIFLILLALGASFAVVQQDFSNVEIKTEKVAGNIYMLQGRGGNIGISVGEDGVLMVDDQYAPLSDKIKTAIKDLGGDSPKFILNTHWHGDHTGGNAVFGGEGTLSSHTNVLNRLTTTQELFGRSIEPSPKEALPIITFDVSLSLHFNGEEIKAMHYPNGHTDGDAVIYFKGANVVHMGDDFFSGRFPFVDLGSGGSVQGLTANIQKVVDWLPADVKIIPGHGPLSTLDDLKAYHGMLVETSDFVRNQLAEGKSLDEIKSAGLPSKWDAWGTGFIKTDRWIETIYNSYSKESSSK